MCLTKVTESNYDSLNESQQTALICVTKTCPDHCCQSRYVSTALNCPGPEMRDQDSSCKTGTVRVTTLSGNLEKSGNFKMVRENAKNPLRSGKSQGISKWSGKNIKITFKKKHNAAFYA